MHHFNNELAEQNRTVNCFPIVTSSIVLFTMVQFYRNFWATVCKTVSHMLSDRCPVCPFVCPV